MAPLLMFVVHRLKRFLIKCSLWKVITGTCVVFRNPCFHPGDIRVVTAVNVKSLDYLVDVLVFPALGYRDLPSQCSGGDLDGDDFTYVLFIYLFWKQKIVYPKVVY